MHDATVFICANETCVSRLILLRMTDANAIFTATLNGWKKVFDDRNDWFCPAHS